MRETFPHKNKGDSLEASHVNDLSNIARRTGTPPTHSNVTNLRGVSAPLSAWTQASVKITNLNIGGDDTDTSGLYLCRVRVFDGTNWVFSEIDYILDANSIGCSFAVDDITTAYWQQQRGAWLPIVCDEANPFLEGGSEQTKALGRKSL